MFIQGALVGVKCMVIRGLRASHALTFGWLWVPQLSATTCSFTRGWALATCLRMGGAKCH
jgi:hypothetical protein